MPQQPFLFKGSVRLNVDRRGGCADAVIRAALRDAQVLELVERNAAGLDADVEELSLSGGQKQLLCLARALVRPGRVVVLDEATGSIDARTEETVQRVIRRFAGQTVVAVAHRLDTITGEIYRQIGA